MPIAFSHSCLLSQKHLRQLRNNAVAKVKKADGVAKDDARHMETYVCWSVMLFISFLTVFCLFLILFLDLPFFSVAPPLCRCLFLFFFHLFIDFHATWQCYVWAGGLVWQKVQRRHVCINKQTSSHFVNGRTINQLRTSSDKFRRRKYKNVVMIEEANVNFVMFWGFSNRSGQHLGEISWSNRIDQN